MAVSDRLETRLKNVPGITSADIVEWIAEAMDESGLADDGTNDNTLLYLSLAIAYETVAQDAARFFKYTDGDESVDKTHVFENYTKLAAAARASYRKYRNGGGSATYTPARADGR
jgi:hypothetical protein